MPRLSTFYGITISMYFGDHNPPHFHAFYGSDEAYYDISSGQIIEGRLPRRAAKLVAEWFEVHREELLANWNLAIARKPLKKISPLE